MAALDTYRFVLCKATGETLGEAKTQRGRSLTVAVNAAARAGLTIGLEDELAPFVEPVTTRLKVYRETFADSALESELVFYGDLPPTAIKEDGAAGTIELTFADPLWRLGHRYSLGTESFVATDQGAIAWGLIEAQQARTGGTVFLLEGDTATGLLRDRTFDRRIVLELLGDLAGVLDGPDFYVEPRDGFEEDGDATMGLFHVVPSVGADQAGVAFLYGRELASNVANVTRTYLDVRTEATYVGTGAESAEPLVGFYSVAAGSTYGVFEEYASDADLSVQATLDAKARGVVLPGQSPRQVVAVDGVQPNGPQPFRDYGLGDTVRVTADKGRLAFADHPLRVHGIDLNIDQQGYASAKLTTAEE